MNATVLVPVLSHPRVVAWPGHSAGQRANYTALPEMLAQRYYTDAHFTGYSVPEVPRRLDSDALLQLPRIEMVLFVVDVDDTAAHQQDIHASEPWREAERNKVHSLFDAHPGGYYYETRGGYRLIYREAWALEGAEAPQRWRHRYYQRLCYLARRFDIVGDPTCSDWTRLYRTPHATREGQDEFENRPSLGDAAQLARLVLSPEEERDDVETATRLAGDEALAHLWGRVKTRFTPKAPPKAPGEPKPVLLRSAPALSLVASPALVVAQEEARPGLVASVSRGYALAALEAEIEALSHATEGRTDVLKLAAIKLYSLAKSGALARSEVDARLRGALAANGWTAEYDNLERQLGNFWNIAKPRDLSRVGKGELSPEATARRPLTDTGNAERLVDAHGEDLRFCVDWDSWLLWDGRRFARDAIGRVEALAKQVVRGIRVEAPENDPEAAKPFLKWAVNSESEARRRAMVSLARWEEGISCEASRFDVNSWVLNVENGTYDLRSRQLRRHDRADDLTKLVPVSYRPEATCPTWEAFLRKVLPDEALVAYVKRAVGYSLTGSTREHCFFMLYGTGRNGKSTFLEVLSALFGDYGQKADITTFLDKDKSIRNDLAALQKARFVSATEPDGGAKLAEGLLKEVTGGDKVRARFLYKESTEFTPEFKLWLATNATPQVRGTDEGIWRRVRLIPFLVTISEEEQDRELKDKLLAELPGILRWAMEGCAEWLKTGLAEPESVRAATKEYREEQDTLGEFLASCCVEKKGARVRARELYLAYRRFAEQGGEFPITETAFGLKLKGKGFEKVRSNGLLWVGLELLP